MIKCELEKNKFKDSIRDFEDKEHDFKRLITFSILDPKKQEIVN